MTFDMQPNLNGDTIYLRGLRAGDRDALFQAASAPETWADHPATDRYKREVFDPYFDRLLSSAGALAVIDTTKDRVIGCSRYYVSDDAPIDISIGYTFLDHAYWGGKTNAILKRLMLEHAFASFDRVWFHIALTNIRSQKATAKFGTLYRGDQDLWLGDEIACWQCHSLDRADWDKYLRQ